MDRRALLFGLSAAAGCGAPLRSFSFDQDVTRGDGTDALMVQFIGTACFLLRYRDVSVLTDPFFSYLPAGRVGFGTIETDPQQVEPYLPKLSDTQAVVVGHSHYDHVLDLPYVAPMLHENAVVLGSKTLKHIYASEPIARPIQPVNDLVSTHERMGRPVVLAGGRLRIWPILSNHAPQFLFIRLYDRWLYRDRKRPPQRANHFPVGMTLAYLVDFLDERHNIAHRVYIQTTSSGYPAGFFPPALLDGRPVDVGLLAMDCAKLQAKQARTIIDELQLPDVVLCHWEDFFRPKTEEPKAGANVNLPKLREQLIDTDSRRYYFPYWNAVFNFSRSVGRSRQ